MSSDYYKEKYFNHSKENDELEQQNNELREENRRLWERWRALEEDYVNLQKAEHELALKNLELKSLSFT